MILQVFQKINQVPVKIDRISINDTSCSYDGTFKLDGLYLDNFEFDKEFVLKDSFPEDCKSKCVLNKLNKYEVQFDCVINRQLNDESLIIGQQIIKDGRKEVLIFTGIN